MVPIKNNAGMAIGGLGGLLAGYLLERHYPGLYAQLAAITFAPALMLLGIWLGKNIQRKYSSGGSERYPLSFRGSERG